MNYADPCFTNPVCYALERRDNLIEGLDPILRLGRCQWLNKPFQWLAKKLGVYTLTKEASFHRIVIERAKVIDLVRAVMEEFHRREGDRPKCLVMGPQTAQRLMGEVLNYYTFIRTSECGGTSFCGVDICIVPYFEGIVPLKFTDPKGVH